VTYALDLDRGEYVVYNENGAEVAAFSFETHAKRFCEENRKRNPCGACGRYDCDLECV